MRKQYFFSIFWTVLALTTSIDALSQCSNVTSAGSISASTPSGCGTFDPGVINSVSLPSGGSGALEYVWLSSTNGGSSYTAIPNTNASTYDPGPISQTTWFRRCARRSGCSSYVGESNWVQVTVNSCIAPPSNPTCAQGSLLWQNNINVNSLSGSNGIPQADLRFVDGSVTSFVIPGPYPAAFNSAVTVSVSEAVSWDAYTTRANAGDQPNEQWKVVFKKNGSVVHQTGYTGDLATGLTSAEWKGSLGGSVNLPNGVDEIILVHYEDPTYGSGSASSANSVVPVSVCIQYSAQCTDGTDWLVADHYNETSCGGNRGWANKDKAEVSDNNYAKVDNLCLTYPLSKCLDIEHFHPNLQAGDVITGIEVSIERKAEYANSVEDAVVQLILNGNVIGQNKAISGAWSTTETVVTYGGGNDMWGTTLTPDDVDDHEFGIRIQLRGINQNEYDAFIDQVRIKFCVSTEPPCGIECYIPAEGELCFASPDQPNAGAESFWTSEWSTDQNTGLMTLRMTLAKTFVDNTYGTNVVGWPGSHSFNQLVGSDHLQIALFDANDAKKLEFKMDYITADGSAPSGYSCLGLDGDGDMIFGNSTYIVDITSSLDKNFNEFGYVLTSNSPATNANYDPNPSYPNWIYEVWYEVVVDLNAFGNVGFGYPDVTSVHASPSKTGNNSENVDPIPCDNCDGVTITLNATGTDVSCDADESHECEAVHYQNGSHAVWINTLPNTGLYFKFENNSGRLVEYPDGTARVTGVIYNTVETDKRWAVDVYLNDKKTWTQWQAAGGSWKGNATTVGNNYQDWAYYEMDASQSRLIGLGYYEGKELNIQRMAMAPQFRVQVGTAANDKNGNYGFSLWFDYTGDFTGHGDFNFDLQNCVDHGCDGTATATASGGTAPYLYVWDNGATTSSLDGLCAGQYCVSVTDANGCTSDEVCVTIGQEGPCCDNITNGGEIAENQSNCGPFDVAELTSISDPSGGTGAMEIVWITRPGTSGTWQMIPGATGLTYDPGVVSTTTQYRRCARRAGCTDYVGESNIITITVYPSFNLECNSSDASAWEVADGTVGVIVNGGTAPYTYLWNTGATTASISNVPAGVYSVTVTDANGCEQWTECCVKQPPFPQVCIGFRTQTPGGWGATPNGGNPGAYLHANFASAFPSGIEIGCTNKFRFTTAQAITDFLPCGGTATGLPAGIATNPSCPGNVLAGHVLAATISVGFDNAIPSFSTSTVALENLIIRYGTFQGWTVGDLLEEANRKLGGCSSNYSYSQLVEGVSSVNENYVDGNVTGNYLDCCSLTVSCTKVDGTCSNGNTASASVTAAG
ncbi:MAG: hypothetical protein EP314_01730, partial [Bacteroidetes bacterium]